MSALLLLLATGRELKSQVPGTGRREVFTGLFRSVAGRAAPEGSVALAGRQVRWLRVRSVGSRCHRPVLICARRPAAPRAGRRPGWRRRRAGPVRPAAALPAHIPNL